jgi:hypothetical protein
LPRPLARVIPGRSGRVFDLAKEFAKLPVGEFIR